MIPTRAAILRALNTRYGTEDLHRICQDLGTSPVTVRSWLTYFPAKGLKDFYFRVARELGIEPGRMMVWHYAQCYLAGTIKGQEDQGRAWLEVEQLLPPLAIDFDEYIG